jgi:hypothetical protein
MATVRSLFSGGISNVRPILSAPSKGGGGGGGTNYPAFAKLFSSHAYNTIMNLNSQYVRGNVTYLADNLTMSEYRTLSTQLYNLQTANNPYYELTRLLLSNLLKTLHQIVIQNQLLVSTEYNLQSCTEKASVLNSINSILEYLEKLRKETYLFNASVTAIAARVKPEYAIYISMYGIPEGGVFDTDKLAAILETL